MIEVMRKVLLAFSAMILISFACVLNADENISSISQQSGANSKTTPEITIIDDSCKLEVYLQFSPDGKELARLPQFGMVHLSDTSNYSNKIRSFEIGMRMVNYSSDGRKIVTAEGTDGARVWDAGLKGTRFKNAKIDELYILDTPLKILETPSRDQSARVFWAEFSPDNMYVLTTQANGHVKVWNTGS
ncbi:MAG: hypothetical protein P8Y80_08820 [Acidobacteriota bacterium]|jgi:hypothetical protein